MKKSNLIKVMMLAGILPLSVAVNGNDDNVTNPTQEQVIELTNDGNNIANDNTLKVPVTATVNNQVLNVQFTGTVPHATVQVNNALTGATVSQQSVSAIAGTVSIVPVAGLSWGTYTVSVTNNVNGQSVSGDFEVNNSKE